ncbi:MAG TPA: twitching motility protein, partial [Terriglobales bacterium]|nr:twitching motility protein [Terriglobales bacterium]
MTTAAQPAPIAVPQPASPLPLSTQELVARMVKSAPGVSDLILSPGRPPQVERTGKLTAVAIPQLELLRPEHTARIAAEII